MSRDQDTYSGWILKDSAAFFLCLYNPSPVSIFHIGLLSTITLGFLRGLPRLLQAWPVFSIPYMLQELHQNPKRPCQFWQLFTHSCTHTKKIWNRLLALYLWLFPNRAPVFSHFANFPSAIPKDQQPQCASTLWGRGKGKERKATSIGFQPQACQFQSWHAMQLTHSEVVIDMRWAQSDPHGRKEHNPVAPRCLPCHPPVYKGTLHLHLVFFFLKIIFKIWIFLRTVEGLLAEWKFCLLDTQIRWHNFFLLYVFSPLFLLF